MTDIQKVVDHLESNQSRYVSRLSEWISIKSVSSNPELRPEVFRMLETARSFFDSLDAETDLRANAEKQKLGNGQEIEYPPILMAKLGDDPKKYTICIYGHLDVQPALKSDGWDTEPFTMVETHDRMLGRGTTDDKGPVSGWLNVIEAYKECGVDLPVNLKFVLEGMEESGSEGLEELIEAEKDKFLSNVDFVCISDNAWIGRNKPCLSYGLRGIIDFELSVECAQKDLHSGVYGGTVQEAMTDLVKLMASLVNSDGSIPIDGINDLVSPVTEAEKLAYENIDFDPEDFRKDVGTSQLIHSTKESCLMHVWRYPSLSLHGIEGAFYDPGCKTVIPRKVIGKFSIRLVPDMQPDVVDKCVVAHIERVFKSLNSANKMSIKAMDGFRAWVTDFDNAHYRAGREAMREVWNLEPDLTREGGSIPVTLTFQEKLKHAKSVMLLPMGACDDNEHSQNEKLNKRNYFQGMKLFAHYFHKVAAISRDEL